jgi:hypothetical protein
MIIILVAVILLLILVIIWLNVSFYQERSCSSRDWPICNVSLLR